MSGKCVPVRRIVRRMLYTTIMAIPVFLCCNADVFVDNADKNPLLPRGYFSVYRINKGKCVGCGSCVAGCPHKAIAPVTISGEIVYIIDPEKCTGCGACVSFCTEPGSIEKKIYSEGE